MLVVTRVQWGPVYVTVHDWRPRVHVCPWPLLKRCTCKHGSISLRRNIPDDVLVLADICARVWLVLIFITMFTLVLGIFPVLTFTTLSMFPAALVVVSVTVAVFLVCVVGIIVVPFVRFPILGFVVFAAFRIGL